MITKKKTITNELLDAVGDPSGLEEIFRHHRGSKGPFYLGLADATTQLQQRLRQTGEDLSGHETKRDQLQKMVEALEELRELRRPVP